MLTPGLCSKCTALACLALCATDIFCIRDIPDGLRDIVVNGMSVVAEVETKAKGVSYGLGESMC